MILATGGLPPAAIKTKSKPAPYAISLAELVGTTPSWSPFSPINLTSLTLIWSLMICSLLIIMPSRKQKNKVDNKQSYPLKYNIDNLKNQNIDYRARSFAIEKSLLHAAGEK